MKAVDKDLIWDVLAGSCAVLAFVGFLQISRIYHGNHGLTLEDLKPLTYLLFSWVALSGMRLFGLSIVYPVARLWVWSSLWVGLWVRYGALMVQDWGLGVTVLLSLGLIVAGVFAHLRASVAVWSGLRRVVGTLPVLLVASPVLVGQWQDEPKLWLGPRAEAASPRVATVVLLFDELSARSSQGLQTVMRDHGLDVKHRAVRPVQGSTTEVVPQMFARSDFEDARACGMTRVCAHDVALDFAQLYVQRDDVDVVGFHHPYCAIKALRYCQRLTTKRSIGDPGRWDCALLRLTGVQARWNREMCQKNSHRAWVDMRDAVVQAMMAAPTLRQGGVLYVHLPLPHPPARETGSLAEQYRQNLHQGEALLAKVLQVLAKNRLEARVMVFSDHPFRQALWCAREAAQFDAPCLVDADLSDDQVPLIVAARSGLPDIDHVQRNDEVFDVLRGWLTH